MSADTLCLACANMRCNGLFACCHYAAHTAKLAQQGLSGFGSDARDGLEDAGRLASALERAVVAHGEAMRLVADALDKLDDIGIRAKCRAAAEVFAMAAGIALADMEIEHEELAVAQQRRADRQFARPQLLDIDM